MIQHQRPLVSIALATHNGEKYLMEQLDSIYRQTYPNIEVIACDDASDDRTLSILRDFQANANFELRSNLEKIGWKRNFIQAMSVCRGDFIAFADQDDIWFPEKIERLVAEIGEYSLIHSDAAVIDEAGTQISPSDKEHFNIDKGDLNDPDLSGVVTGLVRGCTMMCTREAAEKAFVIDRFNYFLPSYDLWIPYVASSLGGVKYLDESLIYWRLHSTSAISRERKLPEFLKNLGRAAGSRIMRAQRKRVFSRILADAEWSLHQPV